MSSDDCDLFKEMPPPDWNKWLDELMEDRGDLMEDSLYDMSLDEWEQFMEDVSFDLDDFVS